VTGGFMINYLADDGNCPTRTDLDEAKKVAEHLGIQLFTFDFTAEYEKLIMEYIFEGYRKGITPNPDVLCNSLVKFDLFLKEAISYGFDYVATGHYARIEKDAHGICHLLK
jgi:tRNA-specific 2-thiouridylase